MKEIKKLYLAENLKELNDLGSYATGLILEDSDGERYLELRSNDPIDPYKKIID